MELDNLPYGIAHFLILLTSVLSLGLLDEEPTKKPNINKIPYRR